MPLRPPVPLPCQVYVCSANWSSDTDRLIPVCRQYVLRFSISRINAMVYLVHQLWSGAERRRQNNQVSLDDGYRLHFLMPGGHIGLLIESPILHIKHHARLIPYSKICTWNQKGGSISSGFRDATILSQSKLVGGSHIVFQI